jgi:hypothetical protein
MIRYKGPEVEPRYNQVRATSAGKVCVHVFLALKSTLYKDAVHVNYENEKDGIAKA